MTAPHAVLLFGDFDPEERVSLTEAARASSIELIKSHDAAEASAWLAENDASAILLGGQGVEPMHLALGARAQRRHRRIPILSLAHEPSDLDFAGAFSWGADDVVAPDRLWPLTTRLRALTRETPKNTVPPRGLAIISEPDTSRRVATARVLHNAGFEVRFALTPTDLESFAQAEEVRLVVLATELYPDPDGLAHSLIAHNPELKIVISAEPRRANELSARYARGARTRLTDSSAPPENVLFLANELASAHLANKRAAVRFLYGTTVRFRNEGQEEEELGFSYNVSEGGLYVRTLALPSEDLLWLELVPPRSNRRVLLVGEVAWRRPFGPHLHATVPHGFGVKIVDGSRLCLSRWKEACESLAQLSET